MSNTEIKALLFDVFGTVVDWRSSVCKYMLDRMPDEQLKQSIDWDALAEEWRNAYYKHTKDNATFNGDASFVTVDQQHRHSLSILAEKYELTKVWSESDLDEIANAWHYLDGQ